MVAHELSRREGFDVVVTTRSGKPASTRLASLTHVQFDASRDDVQKLLVDLPDAMWIVNSIGIIKPRIVENDGDSRAEAIRVNALFPHRLAAAAERKDRRVIQIATDCVYAGTTGSYSEAAAHDALDVYGKTKSLGEAPSPAVAHLRVSIIGPELSAHVSLLDWFRLLPRDAQVTGFENHMWNGVTTLQFARLAAGIIESGEFVAGTSHIVPADVLSKADLLEAFALAFGRDDITINRAPAGVAIDRTLSTVDIDANARRWANAGYDAAPTIEAMVRELAGSLT